MRDIAALARLSFSDEEIAKLRTELSAILGYVDQLNEVNTDGVEPTSQVTGLENRWREDAANFEFTREQMLASAIETAEDHLKVRRVLGESTTEQR